MRLQFPFSRWKRLGQAARREVVEMQGAQHQRNLIAVAKRFALRIDPRDSPVFEETELYCVLNIKNLINKKERGC
jgi:hypothetical protein